MNKRDSNRLRDRALKRLVEAGQYQDARNAWARAWERRHPCSTDGHVERARLTFLTSIDDGHEIAEAEAASRRIIESEPA